MDKESTIISDINFSERFRPFARANGEGLRELIALFLRTMTEHLEELDRAAEAGDAKAVERIAHKAAGPCDMFGFHDLAGLLSELEQSSARGDLTEARGLVEKARGEFDRIRPRWN